MEISYQNHQNKNLINLKIHYFVINLKNQKHLNHNMISNQKNYLNHSFCLQLEEINFFKYLELF